VEHFSSGIDPRTLAQYLAWHHCGMSCDGEAVAQKADTRTHQQLATTGLPAQSIQQGTRL
jgi:hypothetical protein